MNRNYKNIGPQIGRIVVSLQAKPTPSDIDTTPLVQYNYMTTNVKTYNVIDLFCGCGGLSLGFEKAGFNILVGIDNWKDATNTFQKNHTNSKTICSDLSTLDPAKVAETICHKPVHAIIGGPPCQGFSIAGKRIVDDERNSLYKSFVRMVEYFKPQVFVLENVPNILTMGGGIIKEAIINDFKQLGYTVTTQVMTASDYGVPQNRKRAIFVGTRKEAFAYPEPFETPKVTAWEAISDLPENSIEDGDKYPVEALSDYQKFMRKDSDGVYNHETSVHNEQTTRIISMVPDGGNYKDLPAEFQEIRKVHIAWTRLNSQKPSFTIDTGHRHHFHYKFNRIPTVRESARIQSFPDDFIFYGSKTSQCKQVGNAVPPLMAQAIARTLKPYINGED